MSRDTQCGGLHTELRGSLFVVSFTPGVGNEFFQAREHLSLPVRSKLFPKLMKRPLGEYPRLLTVEAGFPRGARVVAEKTPHTCAIPIEWKPGDLPTMLFRVLPISIV